MGVISIPFSDPESIETGMVHLENGPWVGSSKVIHFAETVFGNEGTVICDCRESMPRLRLDRTFSPMGGMTELGRILTTMLRPLLHGQFNATLLPTLKELYTREYCLECVDPLTEQSLHNDRQTVAEQIVEQMNPGKMLVIGCGQGKGLLKLREMGIDAWGLDISPDLFDYAELEVAPYMRIGSAHQIPFQPEDKFETILCLEVLEHLPEDLVGKVAGEASRLNAKNLITMMDHDDFNRPGHLCIRPLAWWATIFSSWFKPFRNSFPLPVSQPAMPWGPELSARLRLWRNKNYSVEEEAVAVMAEQVPAGISWDDPDLS